MKTIFLILAAGIMTAGCQRSSPGKITNPPTEANPAEISGLYMPPQTETIYSTAVADSFKIFSTIPDTYSSDSSKRFPLILILDANAYFEPIVAELKLATLTQDLPKSVVVGIGYSNFWAMDSLRDRDYTYPKALAQDSFRLSGGAAHFKHFINQELMPRLLRKFKINSNQIILMGHSLGGYFVLYCMMDSFATNEFIITRFVAASPSLHYRDGYLLNMEKSLPQTMQKLPVRLYSSVGTLEHDPKEKSNDFRNLETQLKSHHRPDLRFKFEEYSNFDHMDAAIPGMMKGLVFVLGE